MKPAVDAASPVVPATDVKLFATLQALAALQGYTCGRTAEGWIMLRRFGASAVFDTIEDATVWLNRREGGNES